MVGGDADAVTPLEPVFTSLALPAGTSTSAAAPATT